MKKYKVEFEFKVIDTEVSDGKWHKDYLDNNGDGYDFEEAESVASSLRRDTVCYKRNVEVVELRKEN